MRAVLACGVAVVCVSSLRPAYGEDFAALPSPLRLDQVLAIARARRPEILAARARARGAAERPAIVSALDNPTVTGSIDHLPFSLDGMNWSVLVQQGFPLSRIRGHRKRAAEAEAEGARAQVDRVGLDVELDAANAFLMLRERRETQRILTEQHALAEQVVKSAMARYAAGTGVQADVLRAEIEVARLDGQMRAIGAEIKASEAMLNTGLARRADLPVPPLESVVEVAVPPDAAKVRERALAGRPELRAARAEIERAREEVSVMKSMYAPMAMLGTGPAYTVFDKQGWMFMVGLDIPIWVGKLRAGVAEARAMEDTARAELEAETRMIDGDAVKTREEVAAARERFLSLRAEIVPRAQQAIDPTVASYAAGQVPLVSVIDAAQALWSAQAELEPGGHRQARENRHVPQEVLLVFVAARS